MNLHHFLQKHHNHCTLMGIGIEAHAVVIPASCISVRYWTEYSYSGTELFATSTFLSIPVPDWSDAGQSGICCGGRTDSPGGEGDGGSKFWKTREIGLPFTVKYVLCGIHHACPYIGVERVHLHVKTVGGENAYTLHVHTAGGRKEYTLHVHRWLLVVYSCCMILKNHM